MENGTVQIVISSATILGGIGYIIHTFFSGYNTFKKDIYEKMDSRVKTKECDDWRKVEGQNVKRIEDDVREIRRRQDG
jgi:hypothetical protein